MSGGDTQIAINKFIIKSFGEHTRELDRLAEILESTMRILETLDVRIKRLENWVPDGEK